jgi:RsiW-degrading membrane proteinase PrsW (M82 family)
VLLAAMTLASFAGPFVILGVLWGGKSAKWPPDRPVEWVVITVIFGLVIALFLACVSIGWWYRRASHGSGSRTSDFHL